MKYEKGTFITAPNKNYLRELDTCAQVIYFWLCSYIDDEGVCFPSLDTLAKDAGVSQRTVVNKLPILEKLGVIKRVRRRKKGSKENAVNRYQVMILPSRKGSERSAVGSERDSLGSERGAVEVVNDVQSNSIHLTQSTELYGEFTNVKLSNAEFEKLTERFGESKRNDLIERLSSYMASKKKRYKSHYATLLNWARRDGEDKTLEALDMTS